MKVVIDTNFLMIPHQFGIDIYEYLKYFDIATISLCIDELKKLGKKKTKDGMSARIALKLAEQKCIEIIKSRETSADRAILQYALQEKCAVATNDKELIKALKKNNVKIIRLKQNKYLAEDE